MMCSVHMCVSRLCHARLQWQHTGEPTYDDQVKLSSHPAALDQSCERVFSMLSSELEFMMSLPLNEGSNSCMVFEYV